MPIHKALTMKDVMKMPEADRRRRGKLIGAKDKKRAPEPVAETDPRARLKRWRYLEKPIQIIG